MVIKTINHPQCLRKIANFYMHKLLQLIYIKVRIFNQEIYGTIVLKYELGFESADIDEYYDIPIPYALDQSNYCSKKLTARRLNLFLILMGYYFQGQQIKITLMGSQIKQN